MTPPIAPEGEGGESNSSGDRSSQRAKRLDVEQKSSIGDEVSSTVKIPTKFNASPVHLVNMKKTIKKAEIVANLPTFEEIQRKNIPTKLSLLEKPGIPYPNVPTASSSAGTTTDQNPAVLQKAVQSHGTNATAYNGKDVSPPVPGSTSVPVRHHEPLSRAFQVPPSTTRSPQPRQKSLPTQFRTLPTQSKQAHVQPKAGMQYHNHAGQQLNQNMGPPKATGNHPRSTITVNSSPSQQQQSDFLMTLDGTQTWAAPGPHTKIMGPRESSGSTMQEEDARRKAIATQNAIAIARARQAEPIEVRQVQNQSPQSTSRPYGRQGPQTLGPFELALKEARRMEQHAVHQAIHQPEAYEMAQRRRSMTAEAQSHQGGSLKTQAKEKELHSQKIATQAQQKAMPTREAGSRRNSISSTGTTPHSAERYLRMQYTNSLTGVTNEAQSSEKEDAAKDILPVRPPIPHSPFEATTAFLKDEAAMSTLVRKLLGRVPVEGDECPVVLDGALISALSNKIRLVVHKLVDMQVDPQATKKRSAMEIGKHEVIDLSTDDDGGEGQQPTKRLKAFAMRQSQLLEEEKATVARLRRALADKEDVIKEQAKEAAYVQNYSKSEETSATVQNLVHQLDEGMKTVQRQKQEILSLRTVINQDAADLKEKDRTIEKLRQQLRNNESQPAAVPPDTLLELVELREELKTISETLKRERRVNESNARSYMRAAVHAVKIHNRRTDKCDNKGRPAS